MMMMDDDDNDTDDNDADDRDIIYVIHVTYIKAWAAGVGAANPKVFIYDESMMWFNDVWCWLRWWSWSWWQWCWWLW